MMRIATLLCVVTTGCGALASLNQKTWQDGQLDELREKTKKDVAAAKQVPNEASWRDAATDAIRLANYVYNYKADDKQPLYATTCAPAKSSWKNVCGQFDAALAVAHDSLVELYAVDIDASDFHWIRAALDIAIELQGDPALVAIAPADTAIPKYAQLLAATLDAHGGAAEAATRAKQGFCFVVQEEEVKPTHRNQKPTVTLHPVFSLDAMPETVHGRCYLTAAFSKRPSWQGIQLHNWVNRSSDAGADTDQMALDDSAVTATQVGDREIAFEIPMKTVAQQLKQRSAVLASDWTTVWIDYAISESGGAEARRSNDGTNRVIVEDRSNTFVIARGTLALKWRGR